MSLQPHQERVVQEKKELDERLAKLVAFIDSNEMFKSLSYTDQRLLERQRSSMEFYSDVLEARITLFTPVEIQIHEQSR